MSLLDGGKHVVSVNINEDKDGYVERECAECEKTFKIKPSTIDSSSDKWFCPYCNHVGSYQNFFTKQQIEYAKATITRQISDEFDQAVYDTVNSSGCMSITKYADQQPSPEMPFSDQTYDLEIKCAECSLEYAIEKTHKCCPCCGTGI